MSQQSPKYSDTAIMLVGKHCSVGKPQKRLQLVFRAIYFIVSLSKKLAKNTRILTGVKPNPSYVAIDIQSIDEAEAEAEANDHIPPFPGVDQKALADLVKEKNLDGLCQYGGVQQVAASLQTNEKFGISGNHGDIKHRIDVFGSNTYKKPPTKSFLSFVFEAFKDKTIIMLMVCAVLSLGFGIKQHGPKEGWHKLLLSFESLQSLPSVTSSRADSLRSFRLRAV